MNRPLYETTADLEREKEVARKIEKSWLVRCGKLSMGDRFDYAIFFDQTDILCGYCEIKCRNIAHDEYPTYFISYDKFLAGVALRQNSHVPVFIVVNYTDGTYYFQVGNVKGSFVQTGGRRDRDDPMDEEEMIHVPIYNMSLL